MSSQKYNTSLSSSAPFPKCNILQPKRLNVPVGHDTAARRILGQKGQLPVPVSQLSNQQLTSLLRNSPLLIVDSDCNGSSPTNGDCGSGGGGGPGGVSSLTKRAPNTMAKRNARERNRVKQVNQGFQTLRQHIPDSYRMKKMSKVDTLRCALDYIRNLEQILQQDPLQMDTLSTISVSPSTSTSISFSSEEDSELLVQAFSDFGSPKDNNDNCDLPQQSSGARFGSRIIISTSPQYNENENASNLENLVEMPCSDVKLEVDQDHRGIMEERGEDCTDLEESGHSSRSQSQGQQEGYDGHSDTENNYNSPAVNYVT